MYKKWLKLLALLLVLLLLFEDRNIPVDKESYIGWDVRRFQGTKAWNLAKAIDDQNIREIWRQVVELKVPVDSRDRKNDFTPLMYAVFNNDMQSVRVLLELGADPNLPQDTLFDAGENAVIMASDNIGVSPKILKLLLRYGGNPNSVERGRKEYGEGDWTPARCTALSNSIKGSNFKRDNFEKLRILVEAGADVNLRTEELPSGAIKLAFIHERMDIVLYLLEHGADYKCKFEKFDENDNSYYVDILYMLRECVFRLGSQEYKDKLKVIQFLKDRGLDYWKSPIDKITLDDIKLQMDFKTDAELQRYLKKY